MSCLPTNERIMDRHQPFTMAGGGSRAQANAGPSAGEGLHERLYRRATVSWRGLRRGSDAFHAPGLPLQAAGGRRSSGAGMGPSGRSDSGSGEVPRRLRPFWLMVDGELIVYGATDPGARLTIDEKPVRLSVDGTFRLQMAFPDGKQIYRIQAVSTDGLQRRSTTLEFQRRTSLNDGERRVQEIQDWFGTCKISRSEDKLLSLQPTPAPPHLSLPSDVSQTA